MSGETIHRLSLTKIRIDGGTQSRESLSDATVQEYAAAMRENVTFPPVTVYHDGSDYWLADGFHRILAAKSAERDSITAHIHLGTKRDALLYSVGSNSSHGLPRTNADKRRSVLMLLSDPEWSQWSDREIGRRCAVHNSFVGRVRHELSLLTSDSDSVSARRAYKSKQGKTTKMRTANIGRNQPHERRAIEIRALVREGQRADQIAEELGISRQQVTNIAKRHGIELPDKLIGKTRLIDAKRVIEATVHGLAGYAQGIELVLGNLSGIDAAQAKEWIASLAESLRPIHGLQKALRGIADE